MFMAQFGDDIANQLEEMLQIENDSRTILLKFKKKQNL